MKPCVIMFLLSTSFHLTAQKAPGHAEILKMTKEIIITDSLWLDFSSLDTTALDEATAQSLFTKNYSSHSSLPKDTKYYITGKITTHPDFDLLFLYQEKKIDNDLKNQDILLLTTAKDGKQLSMMDAATNYYYKRDHKTEHRKIQSCIYRNFKINQVTDIPAFKRKSILEYRINDYGLFVMHPKY